MINMPGGPEVMIIILVALIVLGPEQLPKAMRTFGNVMAEIKKVSGGFQAEMKSAMDSFTEETEKASRPEKPQSAPMAEVSARPPAEGAMTEVVARNESTGVADVTAPPAEPVVDRPAIGPADRASG
ncbi:MAG: Sec-independent protein translocase subunit TatA/TatB [Acidimicrobiales bacterium]